MVLGLPQLQRGMIAAASGDMERPRKKLAETVANREEGTAASDTYMRAVIALATLEPAPATPEGAGRYLRRRGFWPGYIPLQAFRKKIEAGEKPDFAISDATPGHGLRYCSPSAARRTSRCRARPTGRAPRTSSPSIW